MTILLIKNLTKIFSIDSGVFLKKTGDIRALDNVSFELEEGRVLGIIGESGSGKTTLAKILCKLISPDSGEVLFSGRNIKEFSRQEFSSKIQMIFQDPFASLNPKLTIKTILSEAIDNNTDKHKKIIETLKTVNMPENILYSYPHQFSGGQRQRIAIARALLKNPRIIIADEPLSSLDTTIQSQILRLFIELKERFGLTFIFISHDIATTANFADYVIVMKNGRIVERGETRSIISAPQQDYTKRLMSAVPKLQ